MTSGSSSFAVNFTGESISSTRFFGVGNSTLNVSMCASSPASLKRARIHSALSLSYGEPTWCGRADRRFIESRMRSGLGIARSFCSQASSPATDDGA